MSTQNIYITGYHLHFMDTDGLADTTGTNSNWITLVESPTKKLKTLTFHDRHPLLSGNYEEKFQYRPVFMEKGGKFEIYYNDDASDDITEIELEYFYLYIEPTPNG